MSIKKTIEIEAIAKDAVEQIQALNKKIEDLESSLKAAGDETKKTNKILGGLSNILKGGLGLAAITKAFEILKETFESNQKVADAFAIATESLSLAFNDLFGFLDSNVGTVIDYFKGIFEDPVQSIKNFGNALVDDIEIRVQEIIEGFGLLGKSIGQLFEGDFAGALETAQDAAQKFSDANPIVDAGKAIVSGVSNAAGAITEYTKSTIQAAKENVELDKTAQLGEARNRILLEQYDRQAEKLRQIRDDDTKTIEERIAANNKLAEVLDEQEKLMLKNVDAQVAAAQAQFDKNGNIENELALLDAKAEREGVLAQIEGFRSEQLSNLNSLERERVDLIEEQKEKDLEYLNEQAELRQKEIEDKKQKAEEEIRLSEAVRQAKINDATSTLDQISNLAGEGSAIGKAAAVASATISGIEGVQNAYTTAQKSPITAVFPAYPVVQAGLAAAFSAAQIKSILSTPKPTKGSSGGGGSSASVPAAPQPAAFNVVGAAPENQLAQAIGEREERPMKAYVVSNEVTNAQALDRNIVETASIG